MPPDCPIVRTSGRRYGPPMPVDLSTLVADSAAEKDLREYFTEYGPLYSGRRFESLGGGGDRPPVRDIITAEDLVAVGMLKVRVPEEVAIGLLDGDLGRRISDELQRIPCGPELGTPGAAELVADGQPAEVAWKLLTAQHGVDYVIAGKLLARKRPRLIPVYDQVVRCQLGWPEHFWLRLHDRLARDEEALRRDLAALRALAEVPPAVTVLRVLDVVLWMRHYRDHDYKDARRCSGRGTVTFD